MSLWLWLSSQWGAFQVPVVLSVRTTAIIFKVRRRNYYLIYMVSDVLKQDCISFYLVIKVWHNVKEWFFEKILLWRADRQCAVCNILIGLRQVTTPKGANYSNWSVNNEGVVLFRWDKCGQAQQLSSSVNSCCVLWLVLLTSPFCTQLISEYVKAYVKCTDTFFHWMDQSWVSGISLLIEWTVCSLIYV